MSTKEQREAMLRDAEAFGEHGGPTHRHVRTLVAEVERLEQLASDANRRVKEVAADVGGIASLKQLVDAIAG